MEKGASHDRSVRPTSRFVVDTVASLDSERFAAFDESECGVGSPVGGNADGLSSVSVLPVHEQRGVTVGRGFKGSG